jgi:hypothetical protein
VIDDAHRHALDACGVTPRSLGFLPHAGPPPILDILPMAERSIDLLFIGNVKDVPSPENWVAQLACPAALKDSVLRVVARRWERSYDDTATILVRALDARNIAPEPQRDLILAAAIELYVNNLKRRELLGALKHSRVVVCGEVDAKLPNVETIAAAGPQSFVKILQLMDNAKIVLNTMPFRSGAHERVFYGLSRGAAILSDPSHLLSDAAAAHAGIAFFPEDPSALDDTIAGMLPRASTTQSPKAAAGTPIATPGTIARRSFSISSSRYSTCPRRIACAARQPLAKAASTVPISGPA